MAIANAKAAVEVISKWINDKVTGAEAKAAVVGVSGGADSALVAALCTLKTPTVGVIMPCHSSQASIDRAHEVCEKFKIPNVMVFLEDAFKSIDRQVSELKEGATAALLDHKPGDLDHGALRSCLRAPTLDFVAKLTSGLIVGTGNRDEDEMTRYYQKRGDGCVDISPIARLHKSEVYELLRYLDCPKSILDAPPSADLWGPDSGQEDEKELKMTYGEVEWGVRELQDRPYSETLRKIFGGKPANLSIHEYDHIKNHYSKRQSEILGQLTKMEQNSKHKEGPPEVFDLRSVPGLIS